MGGVLGGVKGDALSEKLRRAPAARDGVTGRGKRFLLRPLVGARPVSVTFSVKPD
jgi:hypothetical protein